MSGEWVVGMWAEKVWEMRWAMWHQDLLKNTISTTLRRCEEGYC